MLPCALADGMLRTGRLARANWCRGLSAGDARQQLRRDPALPSRASRCLRLAGEGGVVGLLGPPVLLGSVQLPPGLFSAPFSRGRWCGGAGGEGIRHSLRSSRFVGLVLLLAAKRQK